MSLVRYAIGAEEELSPFGDQVEERFQRWLETQEAGGRKFNAEQRRWLVAIRDHIAGSVSIGLDAFHVAPFLQKGGLQRAYILFGEELPEMLEELNFALAA